MLVAPRAREANPAQADVIWRRVGDRSLMPTRSGSCATVIVDTGALAAVEETIDELVDEAREALAASDVVQPARDVLDALVDAATTRTT